MELEPQRVLVGLLLLTFFFILYERLMNPQLLELLGVNFKPYVMEFEGPIFIVGVITFVVLFIFGASPISSLAIALLGFFCYYTFTNPTFLALLGLSYSEQTRALMWIDYLRPVLISGIVLGASFILLKFKY